MEGRAKLPGSAQARGVAAGGKQHRNLAARVYSGDRTGRNINGTHWWALRTWAALPTNELFFYPSLN
jgi:hypothetical protein